VLRVQCRLEQSRSLPPFPVSFPFRYRKTKRPPPQPPPFLPPLSRKDERGTCRSEERNTVSSGLISPLDSPILFFFFFFFFFFCLLFFFFFFFLRLLKLNKRAVLFFVAPPLWCSHSPDIRSTCDRAIFYLPRCATVVVPSLPFLGLELNVLPKGLLLFFLNPCTLLRESWDVGSSPSLFACQGVAPR